MTQDAGPQGAGQEPGHEPGHEPGQGPGADEDQAQPARFSQARAAQSRALLEDYAEMIDDLIAEHGEARITDIAQRMGVTHPTATKAVGRLKREGLAVSRPYRGVFLTEDGHELAARVRARHRTVVDLLVAIGVPRAAAEIDAEGIEHHVSDATLRAFETFLDRP
ncbi:manganese-binding transcriptional regulator MntR [Phaeovulum vinaykumarii]|uniref:Transcriptional regulator MntR n=1 Tax=Phaeovulum vinaykumarii TaxID=407234 RepID=A0A1N7M4G7_9RHOB|nr:manganese-binding transcriptional regulator MntR [Phaeovulum vinaykumarii]SIS81005.1 iron (metal) dependent repressor, DtxR family [Phaeovulum vinaykumarii]SOC08760.1 DtxR family iron (metal) dependent repressor [Phaeovulum vinaykumarii]